MLVLVAFALLGFALIALRRAIARLYYEWREAFPPKLRIGGTRTTEIFLAFLLAFFLFLALVGIVFS